jgi:hypothetical protein
LEIVLGADAAPPPPAIAGKYAIYYSIRSARVGVAEDPERLARALAEIVEKNREVATPSGMTTFVGRPGHPL